MQIENLKPSEIIHVALHDLKLCEVDPGYVINMNVWHDPLNETYQCAVCLTGAVIAQTLGTVPHKYAAPEHFSGKQACALFMLDRMRQGFVGRALKMSDIRDPKVFELDRIMTPYYQNRTQFEIDLLDLADDLADMGY